MTSAAEVYGALSAKTARRLRLLARICLGFLTVFIGVVSLIPGPAVAQIDPFDLNDKIAHFIAYGVVGLVLPWAVTLRPQVAAGLAALTAYSGLVEILQAMLSERSGEWLDLAANGAGLGAGTLVSLGFAWLILAAIRTRSRVHSD